MARLSRRALRRGPSSFIEKLPCPFPPPPPQISARDVVRFNVPSCFTFRDKEDSRETELDEKLATLAVLSFRLKTV